MASEKHLVCNMAEKNDKRDYTTLQDVQSGMKTIEAPKAQVTGDPTAVRKQPTATAKPKAVPSYLELADKADAAAKQAGKIVEEGARAAAAKQDEINAADERRQRRTALLQSISELGTGVANMIGATQGAKPYAVDPQAQKTIDKYEALYAKRKADAEALDKQLQSIRAEAYKRKLDERDAWLKAQQRNDLEDIKQQGRVDAAQVAAAQRLASTQYNADSRLEGTKYQADTRLEGQQYRANTDAGIANSRNETSRANNEATNNARRDVANINASTKGKRTVSSGIAWKSAGNEREKSNTYSTGIAWKK